jgi:hypothetical protein
MSLTTTSNFPFSLSLSLSSIKDRKIKLLCPAGLRPRKTALAMPSKTENYRPVLSSEKTPYINKPVTVQK